MIRFALLSVVLCFVMAFFAAGIFVQYLHTMGF